MASHPIISVIVPAYNAALYLSETLRSLQQQTLVEWEAIIVDDGSTDETATIAAAFVASDPRFTLLRQSNQGEAAARWAGTRMAHAEFIYFLDADDCARPHCLQRLMGEMAQYPNAAVVYGRYRRINAAGAAIYPSGRALGAAGTPSGDVLKALLATPLFPIGAALIRKYYLDEACCACPSNYAEDWAMWTQLALRGSFQFIDSEPLLDYRIHTASQTHDFTALDGHLETIDYVFNLSSIQQRIIPKRLMKLRRHRTAYVYFALACKALRRGQSSQAAVLFRRSLTADSRWQPAVWLLYVFARIDYLPRPLKCHLG